MPEPTTATRPATWSRTFPATTSNVREARRSLALLLDGCPAADDAILCLSEIVANAILHSRSAQPGGRVTIHVSRTHTRLRVEVQDEGGPWTRQPAGENHGRGLAIVEALAARLHVSDPDTDSPARTVAFEMSLQ
jgi:anti-sigma regulatory factor (Ser/Thr protein kinase)